PGYVGALATIATEALADAAPERVVVSFHGLPRRYVDLGDPYRAQCEVTARLLAIEMGWSDEQLSVVYQSRFGREPWLEPYADATIAALPTRGVSRIAVLCPGFTADCLETIEEMGMTNRELFEHAGGTAYRMIPCLNDHPAWLDAMARLVERDAAGWLDG
ncbi:MAG: ferrochelatase, partial [Acidobacteria bacterium]|nr:ferrochelatase [Acidobacteriota bacterium]